MNNLDAGHIARYRERLAVLRGACPESAGDACRAIDELAAMIDALIGEIERRDRAALREWSDADLGPLFRQKGPPV